MIPRGFQRTKQIGIMESRYTTYAVFRHRIHFRRLSQIPAPDGPLLLGPAAAWVDVSESKYCICSIDENLVLFEF